LIPTGCVLKAQPGDLLMRDNSATDAPPGRRSDSNVISLKARLERVMAWLETGFSDALGGVE
jgi:hypothetical protein